MTVQHHVRVYKSAEDLPREEQLAFKIAQVAADPVEVDADVIDMIINRVIDNASVAAASLTRAPHPASTTAARSSEDPSPLHSRMQAPTGPPAAAPLFGGRVVELLGGQQLGVEGDPPQQRVVGFGHGARTYRREPPRD